MALKLPSNITSLPELKAMTLEIRGYAKWYNQHAVRARVTEQPSPPPPAVSPAAAELIGAWAKNQPTPKSLDNLIAELQDLSADAPRVTITLAAPAPNPLKLEMTEWCRKNINPGALVSFRYNSTILGGMVVQYGSHIYDWSFRRKILQNTDKFTEVLRHV